MHLHNILLKQKSLNLHNTFKNLLREILVYQVEKENAIIDSSLLCLFKFLILVITVLSYKTVQKVFTEEK